MTPLLCVFLGPCSAAFGTFEMLEICFEMSHLHASSCRVTCWVARVLTGIFLKRP